jgi:hypothetical protein
MNMSYASNLVLWSVQGLLALFFLGGSIPKILGRGMERWTGFSDLPRAQVLFIGLAEVVGAAGLVLPMATGIMPWLTPIAALGLAVIVLMAAGFHLRANEHLEAVETGLWATIAALIAAGRWHLVAARVDIAAWALVAALALLVPSAIINVIILVRRPVRTRKSAVTN